MKTPIEPLTLTPATANLLYALRAVTEAESYYFDALTAQYGEVKGEEIFQENQTRYDPFGTARDYLENAIAEAVRDWSVEIELRPAV